MNDEIKISEAARAAGIEINALVETYRGRALESAEQIMRIIQRFADERVKAEVETVNEMRRINRGLCQQISERDQRIKEMEAEFRHRHVNNGVNDRCDVCGFDLRDEIHERIDATRK